MSHATRGQEVLTFIDPGTGESLTFAERYPWLDPMGALMDYVNLWLESFWPVLPVVALAIYVFYRSFEIAGRPSQSRIPPRNEWPFNDRQIFQIEHGADWFAPGWEGLFASFADDERRAWLAHPESCRTCHGTAFSSEDVAEDHGYKVADKRRFPRGSTTQVTIRNGYSDKYVCAYCYAPQEGPHPRPGSPLLPSGWYRPPTQWNELILEDTWS